MSEGERDGFANLLLLCLAHHSEVDDRKTGEKLYPSETLLLWKRQHEGSDASALAALGPIDEESLTDLLTEAFEPPIERLEAIADQLERTGTLNAGALADLQRIVRVMGESVTGPNHRDAAAVADAAQFFASHNFQSNVRALMEAAQTLANTSRRLREFY